MDNEIKPQDPSPVSKETSGSFGDEENRRGFMSKMLAVIIGGIVGLFPLVVGLLVFLDPLRSRKRLAGGAETADGPEGFIKVAALDALLVDKPRRVTVFDNLVDAWNLFPKEPIGAVYLIRGKDDAVRALSVVCPHAGCFVDWMPDRDSFQCPCHNSSFRSTGELANENSPSARALDELELAIQDGNVWVKFQNFRAGTSEKIAEE